MINSDMNFGGIHRAYLLSVNEEIRIYIPGLYNITADNEFLIKEDGSINTECYEKYKKGLPIPLWCVPNLEAKQHDDAHPCWVTFENGNVKRPIIMGYLGKGIKYHAGGSGNSGSNGLNNGNSVSGVNGIGKKVLIVPGHSTKDLYSGNTSVQTNYGTIIYTQDARDKDGECSYTRKTAQAMYDYIEQHSSGLSELYPNMNDYGKSLFNDIFNKTIEKGFFSKYQAIVEIHFNSGGNGMFLQDSQQTDNNVISIGKKLTQALRDAGYPSQDTVPASNIATTNGFLVDQRCSIIDGNQAFYYLETKNMDTGVTDADCKKIGEALGKVICDNYKVTTGALNTVVEKAKSLLTVNVVYDQSKRALNFSSDTPPYLDCSSFVYWCYMKAGLLPVTNNPYCTPEWWTSQYFERVAGPSKSDCKSFIDAGKLQPGDVLLRSSTNSFGYGNASHALIVAPGTYNNNSFNYINCTTASGFGSGDVKGTNTFFNSFSYYGILRYKGK